MLSARRGLLFCGAWARDDEERPEVFLTKLQAKSDNPEPDREENPTKVFLTAKEGTKMGKAGLRWEELLELRLTTKHYVVLTLRILPKMSKLLGKFGCRSGLFVGSGEVFLERFIVCLGGLRPRRG